MTGTKGKSTTSALLAHLLRAGGHRTALTGNIGQPLLELLGGEAEFWVVELSSYQTRDVARSGTHPDVAVVTNLFPEHLDWHGSEARYVEDKLSLLTEAKPGIAVLNAGDARLAALDLPDSDVRWFGHEAGWHLRGDVLWRGNEDIFDTPRVPLPGRHNRGNLCAVLTAIDALGIDAAALAPHAATFMPLPHRLQPVGERDGVLYVNDSISTTPHVTLAALDVYGNAASRCWWADTTAGWTGAISPKRCRQGRRSASSRWGRHGPRIHALLAPVAGAGRLPCGRPATWPMRRGRRGVAGRRWRGAAFARRAELRAYRDLPSVAATSPRWRDSIRMRSPRFPASASPEFHPSGTGVR